MSREGPFLHPECSDLHFDGFGIASASLSAKADAPDRRRRRRQDLCDYSLAALRSRLAQAGEESTIYRFPTGSLGMTTPAGLEMYKPEFHGWRSSLDATKVPCAVCIPHGSRLILSDIPDRLQQKLGVGAEEAITFIQMSGETSRHRDGVRFASGQEILLQRLAEGQRARVSSLSLA